MGRPRSLESTIFDDIAEVIGDKAAQQLCEQLGGARWYIPRAITPRHPLAAAIGTAKAQELAEIYHGTNLQIPKGHTRRQRVVELAQRGGFTQRDIALATDYTDRHVRNILADHDESGQDSLFPDPDPSEK